MPQTRHQIGDSFENYVSETLFTKSQYDLVHRTNTYDQNKVRFAKDTLKPDFKFRCKKTQQEFYVEAKFRSGFNANDMIEVISYTQIERFRVIQKEENTPIYIAVGYGGWPNNPDKISLIKLDDLEYLALYKSVLWKHRINKTLVDSAQLNFQTSHQEIVKTPIEETKVEADRVTEISKPRLNTKTIAVATAIGLLVTVFLMFNGLNATIEDTLKQKTTEYYKTIQSGNIDGLENYISPTVTKWYTKSNLTIDQIKQDTEAYNNRHPQSRVEIQWNTFEVTPLNNDYAVSYTMIYKLLKENKGKDKIYHLKIHAIWTEDLKIKSLYEEKI
jgi:peroxiredoxin family protein